MNVRKVKNEIDVVAPEIKKAIPMPVATAFEWSERNRRRRLGVLFNYFKSNTANGLYQFWNIAISQL